ncbi:hypothetical protein MIND_00582500 [Mycena indigotica]|uniref:WD40 repeat-like protein n=1 Tax=Mycena indigotica TaxID=2126181 RepID=A0A8H6SQV1_9AGAR|nr:uncharacterized protein MIND_00582500 [Mycena indigotica]KAF7303533.1 hypothetical protein MIND_00582500 [Mycena indigotica]
MDLDAEYSWKPPVYHLSKPPTVSEEFLIEKFEPGDFPRSAKWCYDGSALLVHCEQRSFRICASRRPQNEPQPHSITATNLPQAAPIVDYTWYPTASSLSPPTFCFAASVRETPVKLLDASDGRLRASYPIVDHRERQIAPHSLEFNALGTRLYCGFDSAIEIFDVSRPGAEGTRLHTSPSKKSKDGLKGIVSALAFHPSSELFVAGSLSAVTGNIALFSEEDEGHTGPVMFLGGGPAAGVTQLHFTPLYPNTLYASFRRNPMVYAWDIRANGAVPCDIYSKTASSNVVKEKRTTNQRRWFDIDIGGRYLGVGDERGAVSIFQLNNAVAPEVPPPATNQDLKFVSESSTTRETEPTITFSAHSDAIGSVAFHPTRAALVSVGGSRHWNDSDDSDSLNSEEEEDQAYQEERLARTARRLKFGKQPRAIEAAVKLWDFDIE